MMPGAKAEGVMVPPLGYSIHVAGASTNGLTLQVWLTTRAFWEKYLATAGARVASYSVDLDIVR